MRRRGIITSVMAIAVAWCAVPVVGAPTQVHAVATLTTALYEMNEPTGSTVLVDSSGNGVNGTIGREVQLNASYSGAVGHRYPYLAPNTPPAHPQHLDRVPDNTLHDPGTSDYAVSVRYRTTRSFGNLIQKGQNATNGGYFKIELPAGNVTCLYKDSQGRQMAVTSANKYNDGAWHVVRCERLVGKINLYMDGVLIRSINRQSGNINNTWGLSIAGKPDCDQVTVSCDYFVGDVDWVRIEKGAATTNSPPTARYTNTCTGLSCTFNGTTSTDPNGPIASYAWTFGDGGTATGATPPAHVYAAAGNYTVGLTVTDSGGLTNTTSRVINVTVPNTPPTAVFTDVCTGLSCVFDGTTSFDAEAPIVSYAWTFGDGGTAAGATPAAHVYAAAGTYTVGLSVTDSNGVTRSTSRPIEVSALPAPPVARFTSSCIDTTCTLDGSTSSDANGPISSWDWDLDGTPATGALPPAHDFGTEGTHTVSLTVTDGDGETNTLIGSIAIAANEPPTAAFTHECDLLACSFDATTSSDPHGEIVSYDWNFGDTGTSTGLTTPHTFTGFGDHVVTLTVTDHFGITDVEQQTITLVEPPVSAITFVGQGSSSGNLTSHATNVPAGVQAGDGLLLFISTASNVTIGQPSGVTGWVQLDSIGNTNGVTRVWRKVAGPTDAGAQVRIDLGALSKANIMVVAYRGTSATDPVATFARQLQTSTANRTTPIADVTTPSWVVSYWMHRDSSTTALVPPAGVTVRSTGNQSGGGRVTTLLADSDAAVPAGPYGGLTAVAGASSSFGTTWTIVLAPA